MLTVAGVFPAKRAVAVVGTRKPCAEAARFAFELAEALARAGVVVLSGGALGIDAAAHRGAMAAQGATVCVAATGSHGVFPPEHAELFDRIVSSGGAMVWPFADDAEVARHHFFARNRVLVALSEAVVVVQAPIPSGALNAAFWAKKLGRRLFVVPASPWTPRFAGSMSLLEGGALAATSIGFVLSSLGLGTRSRHGSEPLFPMLSKLAPSERKVLESLEESAMHADEIALRSGFGSSVVSTALLTLALEGAIEEGPSGFYRRRTL
jgi:DNA processing protein